jgi:DNA/RNA endonuclease YhcR with UshA esterase domain
MRHGIHTILLAAAALAVLGMSSLATAHHSAAMWVLEKRISVTGTIKSVSFRNPHGQMELQVTGANGKVTPWRVEMSAKNLLMRRGWKPDKVKIGDKVTVTGHPNKALPNEVYMREIKLSDGTSFGDPEGKDKQLD